MATKLDAHESVTLERAIRTVARCESNLECLGICIDCGAEANACEPDARERICEACGVSKVYGAEELLIMMARGTVELRVD